MLTRLLAGSGLGFRFTGERTVLVYQANQPSASSLPKAFDSDDIIVTAACGRLVARFQARGLPWTIRSRPPSSPHELLASTCPDHRHAASLSSCGSVVPLFSGMFTERYVYHRSFQLNDKHNNR
jgi:hypothetical protein